MKTSHARRFYILNTFGLTQAFEGAPWIAFQRESMGGKISSSIANYDKAACIAAARRAWCHFNWADEVEAFNEIFPR